MRILYLHRGYFPHSAGAELMTYCVATEMQKRGHQVGILCQGLGNELELSKHAGIEIFAIPGFERLTGGDLTLPWQFDIVHAVDAVWAVYLQCARDLARIRGVPLVITPASTIDVWEDVTATLEVCRQADLICVLTQAERAQFATHGILAERLTVIGQGAYLNGTPDPVTFREQYHISGPIVLFLGRKVAFKGYKRLLAAMAAVWEQQPTTHFVFIGTQVDADCQQTFQAYADPRMIEISSLDETGKHSALLACDLVCLPSTADVFPLVFVEAWSCRKPVIACPYPGVEEIVQHGHNGLVVEATPAAIASAIVDLLAHDEQRHKMGAAGLSCVQQEFNWARVTDHIESAYHSILHSFNPQQELLQ